MDFVMDYLDMDVIRTLTLEGLIKGFKVEGILNVRKRTLPAKIRQTGKFDNVSYKDPVTNRSFSGWKRIPKKW